MVTYVIVFFFLAGTAAITAFLVNVRPNFGGVPVLAYLNPLVALYSTFPGSFAQGMPLNFAVGSSRMVGLNTPVSSLQPWHYNFIGDGIIIIVLLFIAVLLLDPVGRFSRLKRLFRRKKTVQVDGGEVNREVGI